MLDGKVGCEEEEGNQACGGEECSLLFPKSFGLRRDRKRDRDEIVLIIKERLFRDAHRETHGGGGDGEVDGREKERNYSAVFVCGGA